MSRPALTEDEVTLALGSLPGWSLAAGKLRREFVFSGFVEAFGFMSSMALVSEALDHHPEWSNVYSRVVVELTTHDAGGITARDLEWAAQASALVSSAKRPKLRR